MSDVFLCSLTNSQMFTTCCETAICSDQQKCPSCGSYIYPFHDGMSDQDIAEFDVGYCYGNVGALRWWRAYK